MINTFDKPFDKIAHKQFDMKDCKLIDIVNRTIGKMCKPH